MFFTKHAELKYDPEIHWTNSLRSRACFPPFSTTLDMPVFHLTAASAEFLSSLLAEKGHRDAPSWKVTKPEYHFETAITSRGRDHPFLLPVPQLERVSGFQFFTEGPLKLIN